MANNNSRNLSKYRNLFFKDHVALSTMQKHPKRHLPKRIILVRHGESQVNEDEAILQHVPNYQIKLNKTGHHQARTTASKLRETVFESQELKNWKVLFYVSPSRRTTETVEGMIDTFSEGRVVGLREECRLREQHFGNFQDVEERRRIKQSRNSYGKFFYRVPDGESSADAYDRVSTFIEELRRDMESGKFNIQGLSSGKEDVDVDDELNLIVVSHGLTILLFLMKWFNWTVDQFEALTNPRNCEYRVLELGDNGEHYSLAVHHQLEELKEWGLSKDMIEDQKIRASNFDSECPCLKCVQ